MRRTWGTTVGLVVGLTGSHTAFAWKPITHVYLAQQAVNDLLDDESLDIDEVDLTIDVRDRTKNPLKPRRKFASSTAIRTLLQKCAAEYYAGVLGPDAYPDILTGQELIHPPGGPAPADGTLLNVNGPGTSYYWNRMWEETKKGAKFDKGCNRAFALGMFSHGAGDMFAHTFVNGHTGNIFQPSINGVRHILLEGYLYQRTPPLGPHKGQNLYELVRKAMNNDIATFARTTLDPFAIGDRAGDDRGKSFLHQFGKLREWVHNSRMSLDELQRKWSGEYQAAEAKFQAEWARCSGWDPRTYDDCANAAEIAISEVAVALAKHELGGGVLRNVVLPYMDAWIADIDEGLIEWVRVSHRVGVRLMFTDPSVDQPGSVLDDVGRELKSYALKYILRMIGFPDWVSQVATYVNDFVTGISDAIAMVTKPIEDAKKDFVKFVIKQAFGLDVDELKEYWTNPGTHLDAAFNTNFRTPGGFAGTLQRDTANQPVTVLNLNKWMGITALDQNVAKDKQTFDWRHFPPAFNTVQMIKLAFLDATSVDDLLHALGSSQSWPRTGDNNVMVGKWLGALDAGNQWMHGENMIFARECRVFNRIFMKHTGPTADRSFENKNWCATSDTWVKPGANRPADFRVVGPTKLSIETGATHRFALGGAMQSVSTVAARDRNTLATALRLSRSGVVRAALGKVGAIEKDANGFTFKAPSDITSPIDVEVLASNSEGEVVATSIRVIPVREIAPSVKGVLVGRSIPFFVPNTEGKVTWRVSKGSGKFGDSVKLGQLRSKLATLEAEHQKLRDESFSITSNTTVRDAVAGGLAFGTTNAKIADLRHELEPLPNRTRVGGEIAEAMRAIASEEATYYAPLDAKVGETVEVTADVELEDGSTKRLARTFELVKPLTEGVAELKKALDSNPGLQSALVHAAAIAKARAPGKLLAWNDGVAPHLKYSLDTAAVGKGAAFTYKAKYPRKVAPRGIVAPPIAPKR